MTVQRTGPKTRRWMQLSLFAGVVAVLVAVLSALVDDADQGARRGILALELIGDADGAARLIGDGADPVTESEVTTVLRALVADLGVIAVYTGALLIGAFLLTPLFRLQILRTGRRAL